MLKFRKYTSHIATSSLSSSKALSKVLYYYEH